LQVLSTTLADLVAPSSVDEFIDHQLSLSPKHYAGDRVRFDGIFNWERLGVILSTHRLERPRLRLVRDGPIPQDSYTVEIERRNGDPYRRVKAEALYREIAAGVTLVLDRIDQLDTVVADLALEIESTLHATTWVNAYASWGPTPGFGLHWDDHDAFVLQIAGEKEWTVHAPTRPWPLHRDIADSPMPSDPGEAFRLSPGSFFYVPQGWWHSARAIGGTSLHLTFGVSPANGIDFMTWMTDELRALECFRRPLPQTGSSRQRAERQREMCDAVISQMSDPEVLQRFFRSTGAHSLERLRIQLPEVFSPDKMDIAPSQKVTLLTPRSSLMKDPSGLYFEAASLRFKLDDHIAPVIERLQETSSTTMKDLLSVSPTSLSSDDLIDFLRTLQDQGIVSIEK
jgi:Cupin superfamily protein